MNRKRDWFRGGLFALVCAFFVVGSGCGSRDASGGPKVPTKKYPGGGAPGSAKPGDTPAAPR